MRIVEAPGDRIEDSSYAILGHAAAEKGVALEGAEGVVCDFGVGGRGTLADQVKIDVGSEGRGIEQDEPDVDAQFGLDRLGQQLVVLRPFG